MPQLKKVLFQLSRPKKSLWEANAVRQSLIARLEVYSMDPSVLGQSYTFTDSSAVEFQSIQNSCSLF